MDTIIEKRFPIMKKSEVAPLFTLGTIQTGLTYSLQYIAMIKAASINCSILNGSSFIFMNITAHFMFKDDKITLRKAIGALSAFAGILCCFLLDGSIEAFTLSGEGLMLLSIMSFAFATSLSRLVTKGIKPIVASGYSLFIGGVEILIIALIKGGVLSSGSIMGYTLLLFLALVSSTCLLLWIMLVKKHGVSKIAVFQCVNPPSGAIAASLLLKENVFQLKYILSLLLVTIGIIIVNTKIGSKYFKDDKTLKMC